MATKAQIARKKYGMSLVDLSGGEKAAVTRAFNAQGSATQPVSGKTGSISVGQVEIKFTRAGGRSKTVKVNCGVTYGEALEQAKAFKFNSDKEGLQDMKGNVISLSDTVKTGNILVSPNIDSAY